MPQNNFADAEYHHGDGTEKGDTGPVHDQAWYLAEGNADIGENKDYQSCHQSSVSGSCRRVKLFSGFRTIVAASRDARAPPDPGNLYYHNCHWSTICSSNPSVTWILK